WGNTTNSSTGSESVNIYATMTKTFYKLTLQMDGQYQHEIDPVFEDYVNRLGVDITPEGFIYTFGSHYAGAAIYGGMFISNTSVNKSTYEYSSLDEDSWQAEASASYKGVTATVGGGQSKTNLSQEFQSQMNGNHKAYSVGGDQTTPSGEKIDNIQQWAPTVANKLAIVGVDLIRISDLLNPRNFPDIPNINQKRNLLEQVIRRIEREADENKAQKEPANFFQKTPVTFTFKVQNIGGGVTDDEGDHNELEVYGRLNYGIYTKSGIPLEEGIVFNKTDNSAITCGNNANPALGATIKFTVPAEHVNSGYASVWGNLLEYDETVFNADDNFTPIPKNGGQNKIPLSLLTQNNQSEGKEVKAICPDNGYVYITTELTRTEDRANNGQKKNVSETDVKSAIAAKDMKKFRQLVVEQEASIRSMDGLLSDAITEQNVATLNTLLDYGARPTQSDLDKAFSSSSPNPKIGITLIERGAIPNQTHLEKAINTNDEGLILACIRGGATPSNTNLRTVRDRPTP
ncbi:MAG: MAC/perforin domain-containing protein, partial [Bacteroidota bacterium]